MIKRIQFAPVIIAEYRYTEVEGQKIAQTECTFCLTKKEYMLNHMVLPKRYPKLNLIMGLLMKIFFQ